MMERIAFSLDDTQFVAFHEVRDELNLIDHSMNFGLFVTCGVNEMSDPLIEYSARLREESASLIRRTRELREQGRKLRETSRSIRQALKAFKTRTAATRT